MLFVNSVIWMVFGTAFAMFSSASSEFTVSSAVLGAIVSRLAATEVAATM